MGSILVPIAAIFWGMGFTLFYYGALRVPTGISKGTFIILMIFALVWPFLHFAAIGIWVKFLLTDEHFLFRKILFQGIFVGGFLFYAFLGTFVFKTFREESGFLTFALSWIFLGITLNFFFGLASLYFSD
ncbi:hypothetical protein LEP1GSC036_4731 [Leptospira weilii str. 2006001853]|uniref:Uncharacterized protein n=2 Tax=Leptospira weilii TaxID=28184 RepID=A0A828YZ69_9LEPT|nr:hypothetical protein [Leptospira weilii]EKR62753.1 hypothetical protein LEP1GSC036_4731 [Leptospira weilii str. 2006001853]EMM71956.1 hypothetical protein LEP1GSC038_4285 [Leptospira weilii str. 2006001855]OMI16796.1 hypothetical protein BUQ74_13665 [Leptospira weilii serovar Heyan]